MIASYLRQTPSVVAAELSELIAEHRISRSQFKDEEKDHETDIEFLLKDSGGDYRKKLSQKLVIEPTLRLLKEYRVKPSRTLPLSQVAHALFDLFGIAARDRVTDAAVTSAWRKLNRQKASGVYTCLFGLRRHHTSRLTKAGRWHGRQRRCNSATAIIVLCPQGRRTSERPVDLTSPLSAS
jgi:hypothetical protein